MDGSSRELIEDCFLRPITNARSTNVPVQPAPSKVPLKTEMQVLRLSEESQKMTMDTLKSVHGDDFKLEDASKYKDVGGRIKKAYWEDRGSLMVQSVQNFSNRSSLAFSNNPEDRLRRYAILKLESYGFAQSHCIEAYDHCCGNIDGAIFLLYEKYMKMSDTSMSNTDNVDQEELILMRDDEKVALESIYDKAFEEKERNAVWSLKFKIDLLLNREKEALKKDAQPATKKTKEKMRCFNFDRNGKCKYGNKCRFLHIKEEPKDEIKSKANLDENENEKWVYIEVRFPPDSTYPYKAPYILVKTTCHDIRYEHLLRISRHLYSEARKICEEGLPCVYSICETLQIDGYMQQIMENDQEPFLDPDRSIFYVAANHEQSNSDVLREALPTHYEKGQLGRGETTKRDPDELQRENRQLLKRFLENQDNKLYLDMMRVRQKLPAFAKMMEILQLLDSSQVIVISGETGCGKSTQVPQFLLDNWLFESNKSAQQKMSHCEIICTQPRRLSAIGVAERVASERAERIGKTVGYQIRLENKISSATRLTFCTIGILLRRLASDPLLESVTHIIVDEVHERSEESDFLLMILKDILKHRSNLKVILMSATLNAKLFSEYFDGAPVLDIPGRTFPVEQLFLEDILESCDYIMEYDSQFCRKISKKEEQILMDELEYADIKSENAAPPTKYKDETLNLAATYARYNGFGKTTCKTIYLMEPMKVNPELIESVLKYITEGDHNWPREGSILVFLPGFQEIQAVHEALLDNPSFGNRQGGKYIILPLHSTLSSEEQAAIFKPAPKNKRKIILSTNIAETSVTIDDCVFVIDSGLMKEKSFDSNRNMESLDLVWVSRANALQRKGRAGRVMPGICIHLFTSIRYHHHLLAQPIPEIHRVPLEALLLRLKTLPNFMDKNVVEVLGGTLEPPTESNIIAAVTRLQDVGAFDEEQNLTPLGEHLSALPVDVRIGKLMLYGAIFQCLDSVLTIAACLSHKSPFVSPFNKRAEAEKRKRSFAIANSDHLTSLIAYKKWLDVAKRNFFASRNYADENFLSLKTLETISEVKYQFLELLVSIGFVPVNVPRSRKNASDRILELTGHELNVNGENNRLLMSLVYASLYPNIAKILTPEKSYIQTASGAMPKLGTARDLRFKTRNDGYVAVHPSSVVADIATFQSPFLIFQEKVKTSRIFIRECSMLPLVPLVLFAGSDFRIELHDGEFLFVLEDGWIIFKAHNHQTAEMIQCLRTELFKLLEEKICDPCLNLLHHENGRKIIQNIVYLISNNN